MSDIEKAKEHIKNLANDYKCCDNTISFEEALALNEALQNQKFIIEELEKIKAEMIRSCNNILQKYFEYQNPCKGCDYFADDIISYCRKSEVEGD